MVKAEQHQINGLAKKYKVDPRDLGDAIERYKDENKLGSKDNLSKEKIGKLANEIKESSGQTISQKEKIRKARQ